MSAADEDEKFDIPVTPVRRRDDSTAKLFGFALSDVVLLVVTFMAGQFITSSALFTFGLVAAVFLYIRKFKEHLPDQYFNKLFAYMLSKHNYFRAAGRDTEWSTPIAPLDSRTPLKRLYDQLMS